VSSLSDTLLAMPLLFRPDLAITDTDVDALAKRLALAMKLSDFERIGSPASFLYRASTVTVGDLVASTGFHSPMRVVTEETPRATVILALGGDTTFSYEGGSLRFGTLHDLAYLPGCAFVEHSSWISGVLFSVDVDRLIRTAATMAGLHGSTYRLRQRLQRPQLVRPTPGSLGMEVVKQLHTLFTMLDAPHLEQEQLLGLLALDDLLYRAIAMAFCGDLIRSSPENGAGTRALKRAVMEDLLAWIEANLDRPIRLSDLEQRSSYSQRTLRKAFQERCGCGPHEWIHRQRMQAARNQLLHAQAGDSVTSIARRWGYTHLSQFSRDFHRTFGISPSRVLREARQNLL